MTENARISPLLGAACGAAAAYYCLFPLYRSEIITINALLALLFIPVAVLCFFRVLVSWPFMGDVKPPTVRVLRLTPIILTAFTAGLSLGIGAGAQSAQKISFGIPEENVQGIYGTLLDDPRLVSGGRAMTTLSLKTTVAGRVSARGIRVSARGTLTVFFPEENAERLREFGRGTEVFAEGTLRKSDIGGNADGDYLFSAESLHITKQAPPFEHFRTGLRTGLTRRFTHPPAGAPPLWGGLALALLLGIRDNLDASIAVQYRDAGCSHILALSGMHLAVLVALISFLLRRILGLRLSAICGAVLILAYCYIVGPLPSLNRAALMYLVGVFAVLGMLKREALSLLCIAFLIQLVITPKAGLSLSFILSYLALAGILIIGESLNSIFKGKAPAVLLVSLSASLGAFIATAGVTAWFFGILRPVGIIASLVLTPLTTVFMIGSMIWLALNLALPALSPLLGYPLLLLYRLMDKTAFIAALTPGIKGQPWLIISLSLLSMAVIFWFEYRRRLAANRLEPFA
jgi:competence protein ComEC